MTFKAWLKQTKVTDDPVGDFVQDALRDRSFPNIRSYRSLKYYLQSRSACVECMTILPEVWFRYVEERKK